jgi:hypothetical protein
MNLTAARAARQPTTASSARPAGILQRQCSCGQHTVAGGECKECKKKQSVLQRFARSGNAPETIPPVVDKVLASPGSHLDAATRHLMERSFSGNFSRTPALAGAQAIVIGPADDNFEHEARRQAARVGSDTGAQSVRGPVSQARYDFAGVRVHTGGGAAAAARSVNADAFTLGDHIVFGNGQYAPETAAGRQLIAHELTHVVQQNHAPASGRIQRVGIGQAIARFFGGGTFTDDELKAYLAKLEKDQKIEDANDSDNKAREVVRRWKAGKAGYTVLIVPIRILLIKEMASGYLSGDDQKGILDLLQEAIPVERAHILPAIGIDTLKGRFDGDQRKKLDALIDNQEIETIGLTDDWSVSGTKTIVQRHGDAGLLAQVLKLGFKIFRFDTAFDKWKYEDGKVEENELTGLAGNTDRYVKPQRIRLRKSLHNEEAASTLFHEGTHAISPEPKTDAEYLEDEAQARVAEEGFRERHGMEPDDPSYRTAKGKPDVAAIRKDVTGSPHYNPKLKKRKRIGRRYVGEKETTGWEP